MLQPKTQKIKDNMAFVYWVHLPEHTDMFSTGYIGITSKTVAARMSQHKSDALTRKSNRPFANAIRKYGIENIVVDTLVVGSLEYCQLIEKKLRPSVSIGWNLAIGGDSPRLGSTASDESKLKMSKAQKGRKHSEETKKKIGAKSKLFRHSEESKAKMSESQKGRTIPEDVRAKISKAGIGRVCSEATKEKLRPHWDKNTFSDLAKQKALEYLKSLSSWEVHSANKAVWVLADKMYKYTAENPTHGSKRLANYFGFKECSVMGILKKLRTGWCPLEDEKWLKFHAEKENYVS